MPSNRSVASNVVVSANFSASHDTSVQPASQLIEHRGFYQRRGKRVFDLITSAIGLLLLSPVFAVIAVLVKSSSRGPILFRQQRVGKDGRLFRVLKFRSMVDGAEHKGKSITSNSDPRVTSLGLVLRKWKLDELPQLWNVLIGEMSLVGPRPEVPSYVVNYTSEQRQVLKIRPGITDPASIRYRNEGGVLDQSDAPELLYREKILPEKLSLNIEYLKDISFTRDFSLVVATLRSIVKS